MRIAQSSGRPADFYHGRTRTRGRGIPGPKETTACTSPKHCTARCSSIPIASRCASAAAQRTFREFADRVARLAGALQKLGMQPGDRVAMLSLNSDRYLEYQMAVPWGGGVLNPCNIRWSPAEILYSLNDSGSTILLVDETFAPLVEQFRREARTPARGDLSAATARRPPACTATRRCWPTPRRWPTPCAAAKTWPASSTPAAPPASRRA